VFMRHIAMPLRSSEDDTQPIKVMCECLLDDASNPEDDSYAKHIIARRMTPIA
jgi:hypothetical protein